MGVKLFNSCGGLTMKFLHAYSLMKSGDFDDRIKQPYVDVRKLYKYDVKMIYRKTPKELKGGNVINETQKNGHDGLTSNNSKRSECYPYSELGGNSKDFTTRADTTKHSFSSLGNKRSIRFD